uniref:Putative ovule protein n=1 Tax=Solanum chacoense TaxID=4108 RepID=A0A0V0HPZ6_SOLCH
MKEISQEKPVPLNPFLPLHLHDTDMQRMASKSLAKLQLQVAIPKQKIYFRLVPLVSLKEENSSKYNNPKEKLYSFFYHVFVS